MEMVWSSILSDLTSRSISFLIERCSRSPTVEETLSNLERILVRVDVIVEEGEKRQISNQAMLRQLNQLRKDMCIGYLMLDRFRCRGAHEENQVSPSFTTSIFSTAKRIRFSIDGSNSSEQEQLRQVLHCLEAAIRDTSELVVFLNGCPRRCRQPYSMYLILDHCMFGRQMEMERIMDFLLHEEAPFGGNTLGVLPIVGPLKAGKSTLIEHVSNHERVRDHFSRIMCFRQYGIRDERKVAALSDCDVIKHGSSATGEERVLVIIEVVAGMDEDVWRTFYSDCKDRVAVGSKIIVASQSYEIARFGTTQALEVKLLTPEESWYFLKVRAFGSTNPKDHPKLTSIAMDLARETDGNFFTATVCSSLLRANFNAHFWSMALARMRKFKQINPLLHGQNHVGLWQDCQLVNVPRVNKTSSEYLVILHDYETGFVQAPAAQNEVPQISIQDLLFGSNNVRPRGRFEVVAWRSHIPPHYCYMWGCEVRRPQRMVSRRRRIQQIQQS